MAQEASAAIQWMPVISSLSGAVIALIATFGATLFNHTKVANSAKEQRQRERLETIYHSLILIGEQYLAQLNQIMSMIDGEPATKPDKTNGIPAILQLEMYVNLYFPQLKNEHNEFIKARNKFASLKIKALSGELRTMTPQARKIFLGNVIDASEFVDCKLNDIREKIYTIAKA
jgi:hypothetical protein